MGRLFGTDGIRGAANKYPLTAEVIGKIGRAVASIFSSGDDRAKIIIGKDTRESGEMIEDALTSGICSAGGDVSLAGVLPTPAVAHLTSSTDASAGIVISASHNPYYDNGIKIFDADGGKLADPKEDEIEYRVLNEDSTIVDHKPVEGPGNVEILKDAPDRYLSFLQDTLSDIAFLNGLKILLDCSNGATYAVAPKLFNDLGAQVEAISVSPNGKNINANCGSEHPEVLIDSVLKKRRILGWLLMEMVIE